LFEVSNRFFLLSCFFLLIDFTPSLKEYFQTESI